MRSHTSPNVVQPRITVLTPDQVSQVHEHSLAAKTGPATGLLDPPAHEIHGRGTHESGHVAVSRVAIDFRGSSHLLDRSCFHHGNSLAQR